MYQRGDIVSVPFPFTDLSTTKLRPALIISNEIINKTDDVILVMITSIDNIHQLSVQILDSNVTIPLPKNSFVKYHKLVTISKSIILKTISRASSEFVNDIINRIHSIIDDQNNQIEVGR